MNQQQQKDGYIQLDFLQKTYDTINQIPVNLITHFLEKKKEVGIREQWLDEIQEIFEYLNQSQTWIQSLREIAKNLLTTIQEMNEKYQREIKNYEEFIDQQRSEIQIQDQKLKQYKSLYEQLEDRNIDLQRSTNELEDKCDNYLYNMTQLSMQLQLQNVNLHIPKKIQTASDLNNEYDSPINLQKSSTGKKNSQIKKNKSQLIKKFQQPSCSGDHKQPATVVNNHENDSNDNFKQQECNPDLNLFEGFQKLEYSSQKYQYEKCLECDKLQARIDTFNIELQNSQLNLSATQEKNKKLQEEIKELKENYIEMEEEKNYLYEQLQQKLHQQYQHQVNQLNQYNSLPNTLHTDESNMDNNNCAVKQINTQRKISHHNSHQSEDSQIAKTEPIYDQLPYTNFSIRIDSSNQKLQYEIQQQVILQQQISQQLPQNQLNHQNCQKQQGYITLQQDLLNLKTDQGSKDSQSNNESLTGKQFLNDNQQHRTTAIVNVEIDNLNQYYEEISRRQSQQLKNKQSQTSSTVDQFTQSPRQYIKNPKSPKSPKSQGKKFKTDKNQQQKNQGRLNCYFQTLKKICKIIIFIMLFPMVLIFWRRGQAKNIISSKQ